MMYGIRAGRWTVNTGRRRGRAGTTMGRRIRGVVASKGCESGPKLTSSNRIDGARRRAMMRVVPEQLQGPPVTNPVNACRRVQAQGEQLQHIVLSDLRKPRLRLPAQVFDFHEVAVGSSRPAASRAHDFGPSHGFEVLQLRQDFAPPDPGRNTAAPPRSFLIDDAEPPNDRFALVRRRIVAGARARLLAAGRQGTRRGPLPGSPGHGSYRAP